jgi:hypothetical protein
MYKSSIARALPLSDSVQVLPSPPQAQAQGRCSVIVRKLRYADTANSKKFRATASKRTLRTIFSRGAQKFSEIIGVVMR